MERTIKETKQKKIAIVWICRAAKCWETMTGGSRKELRFEKIWHEYYCHMKNIDGITLLTQAMDFETFHATVVGLGALLEKMTECLAMWYSWVHFKVCTLKNSRGSGQDFSALRMIPRRLAIYICSFGV